jgi:hypothetical protein
MKRAWTYLLLAAALMAGVLLLVACGGEEEEAADETPAAAETVAPEADETEEAIVDEEEEEADEEEEEEADEEAEFSPSALQDLDSYRYKVELSIEGLGAEVEGLDGSMGMSQEGEFVAPDSYHATCSLDMGILSMEEEVISIAGETWVRSDDSPSFEQGEAMYCTGDFMPGEITGGLAPEEILGLEGEKEEVNGVDAIHYSLDESGLEELIGLAQILGAQDTEDMPEDLTFQIDIWLAEDGGWPVKTLFEYSGEQDGQQISFRLEGNVTDVNDPDIEIEAP